MDFSFFTFFYSKIIFDFLYTEVLTLEDIHHIHGARGTSR